MAVLVKMPKLGLTMEEGTILKWLKKEGEKVQEGEPIVEIQTDKVKVEEESPASGILKKILANEGDVIPVGKEIAIIASENEALPEINKQKDEKTIKESDEGKTKRLSGSRGEKEDTSHAAGRIKASPAAKRIAKKYNIDIRKIKPSGPKGRIVKEDVLKYIEQQKEEPAHEPTEGLKTQMDLKDSDKIIKLDGIRKIIAEKMVKSKTEAPHFYLSTEVDMSKVVLLREELIPRIKEQYGIKLSFNDIFIKTVAKALQQFPKINSCVNEGRIILKKEINIGVAVALENGLIVPVIKNADKKGLAEISKEAALLIQKARDGNLIPDDYQGGTFTISNLGMYDIDSFSAIINPPESAILAIGKIVEKPVVVDKKIEIKPTVRLTLSCDHRAFDGAEGASFLQRVKQLLENPFEMLL